MNNSYDLSNTNSSSEEFNPWIEILVEPRKTVGQLVNESPKLFLNMTLIYIGGVHFGINNAINKSLGDSHEMWFILTAIIIMSGFGGLIVYNLYIGAINISASWLGGKGDFIATRIAFAWSMVPLLASLVVTLFAILLFGKELFTTEIPIIEGSSFLLVALFVSSSLMLVLFIWHLIILVVTLSEVQNLSVLRSISSLIIGFFLLLIPAAGFIFLLTP